MRPALLRPPLAGSGRTGDFSGAERVTSTKSATLEPRRPGVVGLYLRMPMGVVLESRGVARSGDRSAEDVDALTGSHRHHGPLGGLALAPPVAGAPALALAVGGV